MLRPEPSCAAPGRADGHGRLDRGVQLADGMIPWFPGGHADPWNHVEAAMALTVGGQAGRGRAGLRLADRDAAPRRRLAPVLRATTASRTRSSTPTAARTSPPARGTTSSPRATPGFLETMWPVVERRHRLRARPADARAARSAGPATPTARRGRSRCSPRRRACTTACAARSPPPSTSDTSGPTGSCRPASLARVIAHRPDAFAPKHRWAMDWYYPVLARRAHRRRRPRPPGRAVGHVRHGRPGRALRLRPAVGHRGRDVRVRDGPRRRGRDDSARVSCSAGPRPAPPRRLLLDRHRATPS